MNSLLNPSNAVYHGQDSITHFESLSIDGVIAEFMQHAPNLYQLFKLLCQNNPTEETDQAQLRVATSLGILLKCHSTKVLGSQLLLTMMLLARATSRQVNFNI